MARKRMVIRIFCRSSLILKIVTRRLLPEGVEARFHERGGRSHGWIPHQKEEQMPDLPYNVRTVNVRQRQTLSQATLLIPSRLSVRGLI